MFGTEQEMRENFSGFSYVFIPGSVIMFFKHYKMTDPAKFNCKILYNRLFSVKEDILSLFYIDILASSCKKALDIDHVFFDAIRQRWRSCIPNLKKVVLRGETGSWT